MSPSVVGVSFPTDPKKIRQRIRSYERKLAQEERELGAVDDSYGKRLLLGPLYMLAGDLDGALAHFKWYEEKFPDDSPEPFQYLTWALALHRAGRGEEAFRRLYRTVLANLYLVPYLLGEGLQDLGFEPFSSDESIEYARAIPDELLALWDDEARSWARSVLDDPRVREKCKRFVEIQRELDNERPGPRRTELIRERSALEDYRFSPA